MIINLISLFILIWFGFVAIVKVVRGQSIPWFNIALPAAAATMLVYNQGWLA